jgi:predicted nucleic acid-binding protein
MIVLDTSVLSETLKPAPSEVVLRWLASQEALAVFTTAVTQAEFLRGVEGMPAGKRRTLLSVAVDRIFDEEFHSRVLPFDENAARDFGKIVAAREAAGRPISQFDAMIAAIAKSCGAAIATRDTEDFAQCGVRVINPWSQ